MASYTLTCVSCGQEFEAKRRQVATCSERCRKRLQRGVRAPTPQNAELGHVLVCPDAPGERVYMLYRGTLGLADRVVVGEHGLVTDGPYKGRRIRELLISAYEHGWLAYRHRPDGWYSAEWWPERKTVALCGPCQLPQAGETS
jgi:hypothetical protein